ncbi:MAG TPA: hypothetical protein VF094_09755 [Gaiellaceae bacterium]
MSALESKQPKAISRHAHELWCGCCGYRVVVRREPPMCPMCRESNWRDRPSRSHYN